MIPKGAHLDITVVGKEPARYDEEATRVFKETQAEALVLIVAKGKNGDGFSVLTQTHHIPALINALREVADKMEAEAREGGLIR